MSIPNWYELLLLGLAAFRTWRLVAEDDITERFRNWVVVRAQEWQGNGAALLTKDFIACAWCFGFWISLAWWGAWQWSEHVTLVVAIPFAISALVGIVGHVISDE